MHLYLPILFHSIFPSPVARAVLDLNQISVLARNESNPSSSAFLVVYLGRERPPQSRKLPQYWRVLLGGAPARLQLPQVVLPLAQVGLGRAAGLPGCHWVT